MESRGERARRLLRELILERGYPARMLADYLGVHESRISRYLKGELPRTGGRLETPEALAALERLLAGEAEELLRRWVLAQVTAEVMRKVKGLTVKEAQEVAERLLPDRLEAYRRALRRARLRRPSPPGSGEGGRAS